MGGRDKERNTALFTYLHRLYKSPGYKLNQETFKSKGNKEWLFSN